LVDFPRFGKLRQEKSGNPASEPSLTLKLWVSTNKIRYETKLPDGIFSNEKSKF
jgi:hypothetical protein